ncbi:hypothetical protein M8J77_000922 [Diaphorina citri]|nr:hypothetical protein M8J77_000922 [Diaphorina citri]
MVNSLILLIGEFRASFVLIIMAISVTLGSFEHLEEADEDDYVMFSVNETKPLCASSFKPTIKREKTLTGSPEVLYI